MQNVKVYYMPNSNDSFVRENDADKAIKEERNKALDELVDKMKSEYFHRVGTQFDNAILEMEKFAESLKSK
jgi:hypothetical protein